MDIILLNIKSWISTNCGLAIIDPFLRLHGMKSKVISSMEIEKYLVSGSCVAETLCQRSVHALVSWFVCDPSGQP